MLLEKEKVGGKVAKGLEQTEIKQRKEINMAILKKLIKSILLRDRKKHFVTALSLDSVISALRMIKVTYLITHLSYSYF